MEKITTRQLCYQGLTEFIIAMHIDLYNGGVLFNLKQFRTDVFKTKTEDEIIDLLWNTETDNQIRLLEGLYILHKKLLMTTFDFKNEEEVERYETDVLMCNNLISLVQCYIEKIQ